MSVCMYVCMYTHVYVCIYIYRYMHTVVYHVNVAFTMAPLRGDPEGHSLMVGIVGDVSSRGFPTN